MLGLAKGHEKPQAMFHGDDEIPVLLALHECSRLLLDDGPTAVIQFLTLGFEHDQTFIDLELDFQSLGFQFELFAFEAVKLATLVSLGLTLGGDFRHESGVALHPLEQWPSVDTLEDKGGASSGLGEDLHEFGNTE